MKFKNVVITSLLSGVMMTSMPIYAAKTDTKDVANDFWAKKQITWTYNKNYLSGYPDGTFKPQENMTNAEFISLVIRILSNDTKLDVNKANEKMWYSKFLNKAEELGIISSAANIDPNAKITRDEAFRLLAFAYSVKGNIATLDQFTDKDLVKNKEAVAGLLEKKVVTGYPDKTLRPNNLITRAEVSNLVYIGEEVAKLRKIDGNKPVEKTKTVEENAEKIINNAKNINKQKNVNTTLNSLDRDFENRNDFNRNYFRYYEDYQRGRYDGYFWNRYDNNSIYNPDKGNTGGVVGNDPRQSEKPKNNKSNLSEGAFGNSTTFMSGLNAYRSANGLNPVKEDTELNRLAALRAQEEVNQLIATGDGDHSSEGGYNHNLGENLSLFRYSTISTASPLDTQALDRWKNSPKHNSNLLWPDAVRAGFACHRRVVNDMVYETSIYLFSTDSGEPSTDPFGRPGM
ncbi:S-layer homology domain-containing protein [Peptoniphilus harei]|nr:S-layer homology domain-containing protein [Peptoniphilus harei]